MEIVQKKQISRLIERKKDIEVIDTVLAELDTRYNKGYQDGFKQAKFDCEMDKLDGRMKNERL